MAEEILSKISSLEASSRSESLPSRYFSLMVVGRKARSKTPIGVHRDISPFFVCWAATELAIFSSGKVDSSSIK